MHVTSIFTIQIWLPLVRHSSFSVNLSRIYNSWANFELKKETFIDISKSKAIRTNSHIDNWSYTRKYKFTHRKLIACGQIYKSTEHPMNHLKQIHQCVEFEIDLWESLEMSRSYWNWRIEGVILVVRVLHTPLLKSIKGYDRLGF